MQIKGIAKKALAVTLTLSMAFAVAPVAKMDAASMHSYLPVKINLP